MSRRSPISEYLFGAVRKDLAALSLWLRRRPNDLPKPRSPLPTGVSNLAGIGFPDLFGTVIAATTSNHSEMAKRRLALPAICCVCGEAADRTFDAYRKFRLGLWTFKRGPVLLQQVPHCHRACDNQGIREMAAATVIVAEYLPGTGPSVLGIAAPSSEFLGQVYELNQRGDLLPPWILFPGVPSYSGFWRQGFGGDWWPDVFLPFWKCMPANQRKEYLGRFNAPEDWSEYLLRRPEIVK